MSQVLQHLSETPAEKYEYQAEVSRFMDLIVNSLYSNKQVFLRELISDALDKLRFLSVTDPNLLKGGVDLDIRIQTDKDNGIITIMDSSIGMTHQELIDCLGTIAQSGTAKFLKALNHATVGTVSLQTAEPPHSYDPSLSPANPTGVV
ncbi:hypothetical protein LOK49_LG07G01316 [Camellia lanceoleosa]|uniref:Uncharacterized protein n=1 Tax=Camellia lanceoleosa TaxID=1840588 RepID=A0ACC0H5V3_9ERIC|nr:hypothetical protein LOK49_LG07G01316 [Camellia lanceoleosa]